MKNALVVGGTGMLSNVSLWLAEKGYHVSVIGRNPEKMNLLLEKGLAHYRITPMLVDYRNDEELRNHIKSFQEKNGKIDLVVAWIHSIAANALNIIIEEINVDNQNWSLFHILGSSADLNEIKRRTVLSGYKYHQVQLGFINQNGFSRWLTHEEISNGVINSILKDKPLSIIGTTNANKQLP
ncbi:hypothetical protein G3A_15650 [Bacillus sp. 17376]|uniref:short-chain dehydrogenase n=1 Tax=Mesobacillus boroniphilus TaxID=308892 RepID=UPI0003C7D0C5|nr:short-chain dehydrogenase [Mesobacillus boroniphilus]ESU31629.1 hypothetical protein G3A_15650 [Bacillus sp. 17376]